jgi:hypothetical protein
MGMVTGAGVALTLAGVGGLVACMVHVWRLRRAGLPDSELRAALGRAVAWNMAALGVSLLGLMVVMVSLALG